MKHLLLRILSLCLILLLTVPLLVSCSLQAEPYAKTSSAIPIPPGHTALDLAKTEDGYLLLSQNENLISVVTPLDKDFNTIGNSIETAVPNAVSFAPYEGGFYYFARTSGTGLDASYDLYQDSTLLASLGIRDRVFETHSFPPHCAMEVIDGTLYASVDFDVIIGSEVMELPVNDGVGEHGFSAGFLTLDNQQYFMTSVENLVYRDKTQSLTTVESEFSRLFPVNANTQSLLIDSKKLDAPASLCASNSSYGYFLSATTLYRTNGKKIVPLCDLATDGFTSQTDFRRMLVTEDNRILLLTATGILEYAPFEKEEGKSTEQNTILIASCNVAMPELTEKAISRFNQTHPEYTATLKIYEDAVSLNKDILLGEVDLILSNDRILFQNYIHQDLLWDLEELCPTLFQDGVLLKNIVDAARVDGVSYYLPRGFIVEYLNMDKDLLDGTPAFESYADFVAFATEKDPAFFRTQLQSIWFQRAMSNASEWIDARSNTARFTDESFLAFLESCDLCSKDEDELEANQTLEHKINYNRASGGLSSTFYSDDPTSINPNDSNEPYHVQVVFPLPSASHGGFGASTPFFLGAVEKRGNQKADKAFMEFFFTETLVADDFADSYFITIRQDEYDAMRKGTYIETFLPDFVPEEPSYVIPVWDPITDEKSHAMITGVDHFADGLFGEVQNIMLEEAGRYFVGEISAEQAAEYIQNRVSLYLEERK